MKSLTVFICLVLLNIQTVAKDTVGQWKDSPLHDWFNSLASPKGLCCSFADGRTITDADWDTHDNHYRVRVDGVWYDVPDSAVVITPNKFGQPVVWPYKDTEGLTQIRCFLPGAGT